MHQLNNLITKGLLLGLITGILATLFDSLYLLSPNIHIPPAYPFVLVSFNVFFWSIFGCFSGLIQWLFYKSSLIFLKNKHFCWIVFFLVPFALIYGFLGQFDTISGWPLFEDLPYVGHYSSFCWVFLLIVFSFFFFAKAKKTEQSTSLSLAIEIFTIMFLFQFCYNLVDILAKLLRPYQKNVELFQIISLTWDNYLLILYSLGIILILGIYAVAFVKARPGIEKFATQHSARATIILLFIVFSFLCAAGMGSYSLYTKEFVPVSVQGENTKVNKGTSVILIVLDTVRADHLSVYGYHGRNKNIDDFSKDALVFETCIANSNWTLPSHASLFTGLYPTEHGCHGFLDRPVNIGGGAFSLLPQPLGREFVTLAEIFKHNGYNTSAVISNYTYVNKEFQLDQGFDLFDCTPNLGDLSCRYPFRPLINSFAFGANIFTNAIKLYRPAEDITATSLKALKRNSPNPFFLFMNYMDAHQPYYPPRPYDSYFASSKFPQLYRLKLFVRQFILENFNQAVVDKFSITQYDGAIAYLDDQLGEFISELKRMGLYDSSLIIVTSDHGELFGEHGFRFHKKALYEEEMRVPLLIKLPFSTQRGRNKNMIQLSDVFSTIASVCGLPLPQKVSGRPFGRPAEPAVGEFVHYKYGQERVIYSEEYKYIKYEREKPPELYNLEDDQKEQNNLAKTLPDISRELEQRLNRWVQAHKPIHPAPVKEKASISQENMNRLKSLGYIQ